MKVLEVLLEHGWSWKQGFRVFCPTCGATFRDTAKTRTHRPGCDYAKMIQYLSAGLALRGDSEL